MICQTVTIQNKLGLHARASTKLVNLASRFASVIHLEHNNQQVNAKSIMEVMLLAATQGSELTMTIEGPDETQAWEALSDLINQNFYEGQAVE